MSRILRVGLLKSVFSGLIDMNILTLVVLFRSSVHQFLIALNSRGRLKHFFHFLAKGGRRGARGTSVVPVMLTYVDVDGKGIKTLVIVRGDMPLGSVVHAKRVVGTGIGRQLVRGVFFGGDPLRSKTVVVHRGQVRTTNYVLPMSRSLGVPGRLKLERQTTVNMSRRASTLTVVISRRANNVSITCGKRFRLELATRRLRHVLAGRSWWPVQVFAPLVVGLGREGSA